MNRKEVYEYVLSTLRGHYAVAPAEGTVHVGSSYIQDSDKVNDVDVVHNCTEVNAPGLYTYLRDNGWTIGGSSLMENRDSWTSFRKGAANLIVVTDYDYFKAWVRSARACRFLHLAGVKLTTAQVHGVHACVMDGASPEGEAQTRTY